MFRQVSTYPRIRDHERLLHRPTAVLSQAAHHTPPQMAAFLYRRRRSRRRRAGSRQHDLRQRRLPAAPGWSVRLLTMRGLVVCQDRSVDGTYTELLGLERIPGYREFTGREPSADLDSESYRVFRRLLSLRGWRLWEDLIGMRRRCGIVRFGWCPRSVVSTTRSGRRSVRSRRSLGVLMAITEIPQS